MKAQAVIFDLSAFAAREQAGVDAHALLNEAVRKGRHCALVTELSHEDAGERMQKLFGDAAHHVFSVVVTGADFHASGPSAPFDVVMRMLEIDADDVLVVAGSGRAREAARSAHLDVAGLAIVSDRTARPVLSLPRSRAGERAVHAAVHV